MDYLAQIEAAQAGAEEAWDRNGLDILEDPGALRLLFDPDGEREFVVQPLLVRVTGLDGEQEERDRPLPPLTVEIYTCEDNLYTEGAHVLYREDLIGAVIDRYTPGSSPEGGPVEPWPVQPDEAAAIDRAIAALQSGIDRLRHYVAAREAGLL